MTCIAPALRIGLLDSWLQQNVDGSGTAAAIGGLAQTLRARGHHVTRLAPLRPWPAQLTLRRLLFNLQLPALLPGLAYDLVLGFDIDGCLSQGGGAPYICSIKGVIAEELRHERGQVRRQLWALSRLEALNARRAPLVITTSEYCRRKIALHYGVDPQRIQLVPEGIDLPRWRRETAAYHAQRDGRTILCVARQYPRKRVALLLRAFAELRRQQPAARLVVIGAGPEHAELQRLAHALELGSSLQLLGAVPDDAEVRAWFGRADLFCLPSVQEGFGIVFLEAMAAGLPVVASHSAAIPEVVPHGQAGLLVPPDDLQALVAALASLLAAPQRRAELAAFGARYVEQFDWPRVADRFFAVLQPFLAQQKQGL